MENIFLIIIAICAAFYLYRKVFKSGGCNCCDTEKNGNCKVNDKK